MKENKKFDDLYEFLLKKYYKNNSKNLNDDLFTYYLFINFNRPALPLYIHQFSKYNPLIKQRYFEDYLFQLGNLFNKYENLNFFNIFLDMNFSITNNMFKEIENINSNDIFMDDFEKIFNFNQFNFYSAPKFLLEENIDVYNLNKHVHLYEFYNFLESGKSIELLMNETDKNLWAIINNRKFEFNEDDFYLLKDKSDEIGKKYGLHHLSLSLKSIVDPVSGMKELNNIDKIFSLSSECLNLEDKSLGLNHTLGYHFCDDKFSFNNTTGSFSNFLSSSKSLTGVISLSDTKAYTYNYISEVINHEYFHSLDHYAYKIFIKNKENEDHNSELNKQFFSSSSFELQKNKPEILNFMRRIIYSISDNQEFITEKKAKQKIFKLEKNIFKNFLMHIFTLEFYAELDQKKVDLFIDSKKDQISQFFQKLSNDFIVEQHNVDLVYYYLVERNDFSLFLDFMSEISINFFDSENIIKNNIFFAIKECQKEIIDILSRIDYQFSTYFENPTSLVEEIASIPFHQAGYFKEPPERLAWAIGGIEDYKISEETLYYFNKICHILDIPLKKDIVSLEKNLLLSTISSDKNLHVPKQFLGINSKY